jgi:hypothetical protein
MDEVIAKPTRKRPGTRRKETARRYAGPPPGVPIDLALCRYGPPKLVAELAKLEADAHSKGGSSVNWHPVADCRERIWHALCGEVERGHYCISHLSSKATGARKVFPADRCWYLRLPRNIPLPDWLGVDKPGPDALYYLDQELHGVLMHRASALEVDTHFWLAGQAAPTIKAARAWASSRGYSQPTVEKIITDVFGPRSRGRRRKPHMTKV